MPGRGSALCRLLFAVAILVGAWTQIAIADVPAAPSDLAAEVVSATKTRLTWHDNSDNETWFEVVVCPPQGAFYTRCLSFGLPANTTAFTIDDPVLSECQFVDVYAWNSDGESEPSDTIELFFLDEPSLVATAASADRIDLAWDDASRCEDGYEVWRGDVTLGLSRMDRIAILPPNTATYADVGVAVIQGHMYAYRVYVVHGETQQVLSNLARAIAYAPANLVATPVTATRIDLAWEDGIDYEDGYTIQRSNWSWGVMQWGPWAVIANEPANTTSYADIGLVGGALYRYRVRAHMGTALSAWSDIATAMAVAVPPLPPSDLTASSVSSNRIDLTWQDNSNDETKFKIERKPQGGTYSQIASVEAGVTTFSSTGLSPATTYCYRVRAYSSAGNSAYSNEACDTTSAVPPIGPSILAVVDVSEDQIDIRWQDNSSDEIGFKIGRRLSGGTFSQIAVVGENTTSYSSTGLSPGTAYCYLVLAYNAAGNSTPSNEACATTLSDGGGPEAIPVAPDGLGAAADSASHIVLTWNDKSDNEAGFSIERSPQGGSYGQIAIVAANVTGYADSDVDASSTYCYRVRAYNSLGESAYTDEACATTTSVAPNAPSNLAASAVSSSRIDLTWQDNSNNETVFKIEGKAQGGSYAQIAEVGANTTSYSNTGLVAGTTYCYRVRAYNAVDNSEYCTEACAIAHAPYLVAVAAGSSRIDLTWNDALSEDGYTVQRRMHATGVGWGGWVGIATKAANTTSYADTAVAIGGLYQYRVRAYAGEAESAWSNEATASATDLPPNPPTGLTATAVSSTEIDLTWQDNADNEEGFEVERADDSGGYTIVAVVGPDAPGYSDTALTVDTWYCYRVHAYNAVGDSDASNEACETTTWIRGDINGDSTIDLIDALMLYRYVSGVLSLLPEAIARADIDGDGDVDMADAEALADIVFGT